MRFYASAPVVLVKELGGYVGAVTIVDSTPRDTFSFENCEPLMRLADEVAFVLSGLLQSIKLPPS